MENDILKIFWWYGMNEDDQRIFYCCRGSGPKYRRFYGEWVPNSSFVFTEMDWPMIYFEFDDPTDHDRLLRDFPGDVFHDSGAEENVRTMHLVNDIY